MALTAAIGLRARTGRAIAVVAAEVDGEIEVVRRESIATHDPSVADSFQPHHAALELSGSEARRVVAAAEEAVRAAARESFSRLVSEVRGDGFRIAGVGVVGPPPKDANQLARMGNPHVRAHAAEGQLFRLVLEEAAKGGRLSMVRLSDRSGFADAAECMRCGEKPLRAQVDGLGATLGPPWRADEKLACVSALVVLSRS